MWFPAKKQQLPYDFPPNKPRLLKNRWEPLFSIGPRVTLEWGACLDSRTSPWPAGLKGEAIRENSGARGGENRVACVAGVEKGKAVRDHGMGG